MRAAWKFLLAQSKDLSNIGELSQARDRQLSVVLNRPGSLSFTIPMDDDLGSQIYPIQHAVRAYRSGTHVREVWSGFVNTIDEDLANNRMTVNCVGWYERLAKRILRRDRTYAADIDDSAIVQDLLSEANGALLTGEYGAGHNTATLPDGYLAHWPVGSSPNTPTWIKWGGTQPNEGVGGATAYQQALRTVPTYTRYQTTIQSAIQALSDVENGLDWEIDPAARTFYVYRKKRRILDGVVFGWKFGPENVAQFNRQIDASIVANYGFATGAAGAVGPYTDDAPVGYASQLAYGPLEEVYSLSQVSGDTTDPNNGATKILGTYAAAEINLKLTPRQLFSITPFPWTPENSVPEPFEDYRIGDQVRFVARQLPRIQISQQVRVFGMSVSIDNEGNERLGQLQIYPGG